MSTNSVSTLNGLFKQVYSPYITAALFPKKPYHVSESTRKMLQTRPHKVILLRKEFFVRTPGGWVIGMPNVRWASLKAEPGAIVCSALH